MIEKNDNGLTLVESQGPVQTETTEEHRSQLSQAHVEYLLQRHGTVDLDPLPDMNDADPYNWPQAKKTINLLLVSFHAMMATFTASAIQSAFPSIATDLGVDITHASYLTSLQIAVLGSAPLFWRPIADRYGRRPVFLLSLICSLVGNIGCAHSPTYATMAVCRAIVAFFISPAMAIGSAVVAECFFKKERAKYIGVWTLLFMLGVPLGPFIFGFVTLRVGYRWIYHILAITNAVQFLLYIAFGLETRYIRQVDNALPSSSLRQRYLAFRRIDATPLRWHDFAHPFAFIAKPNVSVPTVAYSMIFVFGSILVNVELPQLFSETFGFNAQQIGLQYISIIIGSVIGEQIGGRLSDGWMARRQRRSNLSPPYEYRLWLTYLGFILTIVGVIVFLVRIQQAPLRHWNVTPLVGAAIASAGNQIVTTVMVTYAVDCYREDAAAVGVFITFIRQTWAFLGPFWFPPMFESVGLYGSAGIATGLMLGVSVIPTIVLQWRGRGWRSNRVEKAM